MLRFRSSDPAARSRAPLSRSLFVAALALPVLFVSWVMRESTGPVDPPPPPPPDTVLLYGPVEFETPNGAWQTYIEEFTAAVPPTAYQAIKITNGSLGNNRVDTLSVKLNDVELITTPFNQSVAHRTICSGPNTVTRSP
jgi:hypothetical protein